MSKFEEQQILLTNNATLNDFRRRFKLIATNLFVWSVNDDKFVINSRYIEKTLFKEGQVAFFKDKTLGYLTLKCSGTNLMNVYEDPTEYTVMGHNYNKRILADDLVIIRNNNLEYPTYPTIEMFSQRLYEVQRTIDVNVIAQKTPICLYGNSKTILSLKNQMEKYIGNFPFMFGDKNYNTIENMKALKTDAPYVVDKLTDYYHDKFNECLTFLGINNANTDKAERMITDEVNSNNELIKFYLNVFYNSRAEAVKEINKKFFDNKEVVKVEVNKDIINSLNFDFSNFNDKEDNEINDNKNIENN